MDRASRVKHVEGDLSAVGLRIGVVASRFNDFIVKPLLEGTLEAVERHGGDLGAVRVAWVPGAHELPVAASRMARTGDFDALVCIGTVIRGSTAHFDYVAGGAASGIISASLDTDVPIIFGVITTENIEQAIERAGTKLGNKGFEAGAAAIEMANLMARIGDGAKDKGGSLSAR
ncbi:6,7-dimethyl-8-ribityllumazine synthase [Rubrobacter indicoceani]|uniref:6,7-dimethyl-8-ribityllumazine synthase n=1 Tax=Rubrobacter indicoceani TaxID=2051957 RepID=UPI000E5A6E3B|nr:6,7-dimethyl-8-ribityllumazine synthase [Rubrobacter indicoceani]